MIGFGTTVRFIGKSGQYDSILSSCGTVSRLPPYGGSDPSSSDSSDVGCVLLEEVVPFACPANSTSISIVARHQPDRRVSDRVMEVEVVFGEDSCD